MEYVLLALLVRLELDRSMPRVLNQNFNRISETQQKIALLSPARLSTARAFHRQLSYRNVKKSFKICHCGFRCSAFKPQIPPPPPPKNQPKLDFNKRLCVEKLPFYVAPSPPSHHAFQTRTDKRERERECYLTGQNARAPRSLSLRVKLRRLEKRFLVGGWLRLCCLLAQVRENIKKRQKKRNKSSMLKGKSCY